MPAKPVQTSFMEAPWPQHVITFLQLFRRHPVKFSRRWLVVLVCAIGQMFYRNLFLNSGTEANPDIGLWTCFEMKRSGCNVSGKKIGYF